MSYTNIRDLKPFQHYSRITVRACRVWRPKKYNSNANDGLHHVLVDVTGQPTHAIIDEAHYPYMDVKMEQGFIYDVFKFFTRRNNSKFRVVDNDLQLFFNESTRFVKVEKPQTRIPKYYFNLIDFGMLDKEEKKQNNEQRPSIVLTDVYGCIKSIVPPYEIPVKDKRHVESKCDLTLHNIRREELRITLWGDISRSFDIDGILKLPMPVLVVVTSLRLNKFQDRITGSNSNHTCIIINPCLPQTKEYELEFVGQDDITKVVTPPWKKLGLGELKQQEKKSMSELNTLNPTEFTNKTVFCTGTIRRFPTHKGWYYKACSIPGCYKQLNEMEENNQYLCVQHGTQDPLTCYRVQMTLEDADDQATVTLMGKQAEQLFNNTCTELINKRLYPSEESLPEEIEKTIGLQFTFEMKINLNNELVVKNIYPAAPASPTEDIVLDQSPNILTPTPNLSEKRGPTESIRKNLFDSDLGKRFKRQTYGESSSKQEEKKKIE